MKRTVLAAIFAGVILHAADVGGRWNGATEMKDRDGQPVVLHLILKQDGNKISGGAWTEDHDEADPKVIQKGTINGAKVRFEVPQEGNAVVIFELELSGDSLTGIAKFQGPTGLQETKLLMKRMPTQ